MAVRSDGTVLAWGNNNYGQSTVPPSATNVTAIAAGQNHCLALRADGTVVAWGQNTLGQSTVPSGLSNAVAVAAGGVRSVVLLQNGTVVSFGLNVNLFREVQGIVGFAVGQTQDIALKGDGTLASRGLKGLPIPANATNLVSITGETNCVLVLTASGQALAWG